MVVGGEAFIGDCGAFIAKFEKGIVGFIFWSNDAYDNNFCSRIEGRPIEI